MNCEEGAWENIWPCSRKKWAWIAYFQCAWGLPPRAFHIETHVEGKEAQIEGSATEASHMFAEYTEAALRCVQGFPRGLQIGQKLAKLKRGEEWASVHHSLLTSYLLLHPGQLAPEVQQSAAMQKHPRSCLHCSLHRGCLPEPNLQHMRQSLPAPPTHTQ